MICPFLATSPNEAPECQKENCAIFISDNEACAIRSIPVSLQVINDSVRALIELLTPKPKFTEPRRRVF